MATILRSLLATLKRLLHLSRTYPIQFSTTGFQIIDDSVTVEEEQFEAFKNGLYYPVKIGEILGERYQVLGKLGYGTTSTVWLARDMGLHRYVALKVLTRDITDDEFKTLQKISSTNPKHPGYVHARTALDLFKIEHPAGEHLCLVQRPMWASLQDLLVRQRIGRLSPFIMKAVMQHVLLALTYLHTECKLVHTDISAYNVFIDLEDQSVFEIFVDAELKEPSPRKFVGNHPIYISQGLENPKTIRNIVLGDFGEAVNGEVKRNHNAQPDVYRSPEVMLEAPWSYPADIWNLGMMIWDLLEGKHMFTGVHPEENDYRTRAHLAEIIAMLGPAPLGLLKKGVRSSEFFSDEGEWKADVQMPAQSLEQIETILEGEEQQMFLELMQAMLRWDPENRKTAEKLLGAPWLE